MKDKKYNESNFEKDKKFIKKTQEQVPHMRMQDVVVMAKIMNEVYENKGLKVGKADGGYMRFPELISKYPQRIFAVYRQIYERAQKNIKGYVPSENSESEVREEPLFQKPSKLEVKANNMGQISLF